MQLDANPYLLTHPNKNLILLVYVNNILITLKLIKNIN